MGIDVSDSMLLADDNGEITSRWNKEAPPGALDEAITLTEAAKIRANLLLRQLDNSKGKLDGEIRKTVEILSRAKEKAESYGLESGLERLTSRPVADIAAAAEYLEKITDEEYAAALLRSASLSAEAALGLRRMETLRGHQDTGKRNIESAPRIDLVKRWMENSKPLLTRLSDEFDLDISTFASDLAPLGADGDLAVPKTGGAETRLYESLNRLASDDGGNGSRLSLLVTDGVDSAVKDTNGFSAEVRNRPLIVLPIGDADTSMDVRIESVVNPAQVREKDLLVVAAEISSRNTGPITVTALLRDEDRTLSSKEVELKGDGSSERLDFEWLAIGVGSKAMKVEVKPLKDEKITQNNSHALTCTVTKDRYRILLCDSFPRWETRYLQNLFRRDPSIELASVIFEPRHTYPGNEPVEQPALPLSLEPWQKFDLVILGDVTPAQLTAEHQILLVEYVNRGGNLLLLAGENAMPSAFVGAPLEDLLPVTPVKSSEIDGTFVIAPPENRPVNPMVQIAKTNSQAVWTSVFSTTPRYRISRWAKAKQSAQTLLMAKDKASGATYDFLSVQRFGSGRVAFAAAPCFYHLRFSQGDRYHLRFWGRMVRGMCVEDFGFEGGMVKTRLDRKLWESGSEVQGRVRLEDIEGHPLRNADFTAVLIRDGRPVARMNPAEDTAKPGEYFIRFPSLMPGEYMISYEGSQVSQMWEMDRQNDPDPPECRFQVLGQTFAGERQFAQETPDFWSKVNQLPLAATIHPQTLPLMLGAIDLQPETISLVRSRSIWDTWTLLLAIIFVSGIEWLLRRIHGLS